MNHHVNYLHGFCYTRNVNIYVFLVIKKRSPSYLILSGQVQLLALKRSFRTIHVDPFIGIFDLIFNDEFIKSE